MRASSDVSVMYSLWSFIASAMDTLSKAFRTSSMAITQRFWVITVCFSSATAAKVCMSAR